MEPAILTLMSESELDEYSKWSKEEVYEAYLAEYHKRVELNIELNQTLRKIAEIKYMCGGK